MKTLDVKSLLIGALLTSTIFLGVAATSPTDKWDDEQVWDVWAVNPKDFVTKKGAGLKGAEPFAVSSQTVLVRRRIK